MPGNSYISCTCFEQCNIDWLHGIWDVSEKCKPMNSFFCICKTVDFFWSVCGGHVTQWISPLLFGGRFKKWSTCSGKHSACFSETPSFSPFFPVIPAGYDRKRKLNQVFMLSKTLCRGLYWNWGQSWLCLIWVLIPVKPMASGFTPSGAVQYQLQNVRL